MISLSLLLILCVVVALVVLGAAGVLTLIKLGVIVRAASQPTYQDQGDYTLDQGREVRPEEQRKG